MKSLVLIATALLLAVPASSNATELSVPEADGWYSWEVASGSAGRNSCCYHWRSGSVRNRGCALDGGDGGFGVGDCELDSEELRVYVRVQKLKQLHRRRVIRFSQVVVESVVIGVSLAIRLCRNVGGLPSRGKRPALTRRS